MAEIDLRKHRAALDRRLALVAGNKPGADLERGIVICAGGALILTNAYVLISVLRRHLKCELPIEVWHLGTGEMSPRIAELLCEFDVTLIDALSTFADETPAIRDGWQLKSFALVHSRFRDVLLLDADQVPVVDPATLFGWPEFAEAGAVFWPDIVDLSPANPIWTLIGGTPARTSSFESGQILVDRFRHWQALQAALYMNEQAEDFYRLVYGDKDTFLAAWRYVGASHALVPHPPFVDDRCLFQRDFDGNVIFQHRTGAKWSYGGEQRRIVGFVHDEACEAALAELRRQWNGRIFHPPIRSQAARRVEHALVGRQRFRLIEDGCEAEPIALLAGGEFGDGRNLERQNWFVREKAGRPELVFCSRDQETWTFEPQGDGVWSGVMTVMPFRKVRLYGDDRSPRREDVALADTAPANEVRSASLSNGRFDDALAARLETVFEFLSALPSALKSEFRGPTGQHRFDRDVLAVLDRVCTNLRSRTGPALREPARQAEILSDPDLYRQPSVEDGR